MKYIDIGILAHVDAGKTTLSEAILFQSGAIRKAGRVDHKDAFLDTDAIERNRGITVFSKEARFGVSGGDGQEIRFTLLDTPGHSDFSCEMERTLRVLDYAILVISGSEGVQSHTMTLWKLLKAYDVPTIIFVNKMDMPEADRLRVWNQMNVSFGGGLFEISVQAQGGASSGAATAPAFPQVFPKDCEELAMLSEPMMEAFLEKGEVPEGFIREAIAEKKAVPVVYGSALRMEGTDALLAVLGKYANISKAELRKRVAEKGGEGGGDGEDRFSAIVYKITRDRQGVRQTHMKVTGGALKTKMLITGETPAGEQWSEKVEQIRIYNSTGFETVSEAGPGEIVAVTGLNLTYAGETIGDIPKDASTSGGERVSLTGGRHARSGGDFNPPIGGILQPALTYRVNIHGERDNASAIRKFAILEEENPSYHFVWDEEHGEIHVQVMGDLELEVLAYQIHERLGLEVSFDQGSIIYKETVTEPVIGIGHYEPLRHYAEVQLLLEPLPRGSGLEFGSLVSEDVFAKNWQRLVMTHLSERRHRGTLTNSEITDMRISIVAGRASNKHTEGGDFRKATYRAIRHALRQALENGTMRLLEPEYSFTIEVPSENIGRVMSDMERLGAKCELPDMSDDGTVSVLRGRGPVATLRDYQREINTFARGRGRIMAAMEGYADCHNQEEVVAEIGYDPDTDGRNQAGSVFCEHGAGVYVDWQDVAKLAHTEACVKLVSAEDGESKAVLESAGEPGNSPLSAGPGRGIGGSGAAEKELDAIFEKTYGKSKRDEQLLRARQSEASRRSHLKSGEIENFPQPKWKKDDGGGERERHMFIDGYNVIFAWQELKALADVNIDSARDALLDVLGNYQGYTKQNITVVFDGYRVAGSPGSAEKVSGLDVVYTREGEKADSYIERSIYALGRRCEVTVVTSDRLVQMTALGDGALRLTAGELYTEVSNTSEEIRAKLAKSAITPIRPFEGKFNE